MIRVTMRKPGAQHNHPALPVELGHVTFEEPHWSAAKDLIRTLESQGWSFVSQVNPETWDDGIPIPTPEKEREGLDALRAALAYAGYTTKPPFDPLTAGWVECEWCPEPRRGCEYCDGLGIVVGPPEDGIEFMVLARLQVAHGEPISIHWPGLISLANAYKMSS